MDEVSSHVCLVLPSTDGKAARKIVPPRLRIPYWKGLGADSEEKHEPVSDIDTVVVDSLKALDPKRPIREADIVRLPPECPFRGTELTSCSGWKSLRSTTTGGSTEGLSRLRHEHVVSEWSLEQHHG
jgi:hypothetical protein